MSVSPFFPTRLPNQALSEAEMVKQFGSIKGFYLETARHLSSWYNRPSPSEFNKSSAGVNSGEVFQILDNITYFQGKQENTLFAFLNDTIDEIGNTVETATPFLPGQDIATILLFLQGQFMGVASSAEPRIDVINPEADTEFLRNVKLVQVQKKFKEIFQKITEVTGFDIKTPSNPQADIEELTRDLSISPNADLVRYCNTILDYVKKNGMNVYDYVQSAMLCLIGRYAALYVDPDGRIHRIEPYNYARVSYKDDDFGRYDFARGMVSQLHKDDFLAKYADDLTQKEQNEIRNGDFLRTPFFAGFPSVMPQGFNYPAYDYQNNSFTTITWFWKSTLDSGYGVKTDEEGNKVIYKKRKGSESKKGVPLQIIRRATIAGYSYVVDYGIHDTIEDPNQEGNKVFPITCFAPNTMLGTNQSLVDRLKHKQQELDAIDNKVREFWLTDLGTIIALNGKKFKDGVTAQQVYSELKRTRMTVATQSGLEDDVTNNEPLMQREDVSLMRDIQNYINIKQGLKQDIKDIANVSNIVMGSQQQYVGLRTQQNSAALSSSSIQYTFAGVLQVWADAAAIAVEYVRKDIAKNPTKTKWLTLLGDEGVSVIKELSKYPLFKLQAYISTRDLIDPTRKQRMLAMLDNLMATGQIDFEDWLNVEDATTITELKQYAKYSVRKKQQLAQVMQMMNNATNVQRAEVLAQGQQEAKMIEQQGANQRNTSDNVTKMANQMIKQGASQEEIAAFLSGAAGEPQGQEQMM